jgi:hypothetical protein
VKVYLVEDCGNCPGKIIAVMMHETDDMRLAKELQEYEGALCEVKERTLI